MVAVLAATSSDVPAAGVPTGGMPWPKGSTLTVHSKLPKAFDRSLTVALRELNGSGARIKLTRVRSARGAKIVLKLARRQLVAGFATLGRAPNGPSVVSIAGRVMREHLGNGATPYGAAMLLAHEIGHTLTLNHPGPRVCSVMNGGFFGVCPTADSVAAAGFPAMFTCRLLQQRDKAALVRVYGGRATRAGPLACAVTTGLPPRRAPQLADVSITQGEEGQFARIAWKPMPGYGLASIDRYHARCDDPRLTRRVRYPTDSGRYARGDVVPIDAGSGGIVDENTAGAPRAGGASLDVCYVFVLRRLSDGGASAPLRVPFTYVPPPAPVAE